MPWSALHRFHSRWSLRFHSTGRGTTVPEVPTRSALLSSGYTPGLFSATSLPVCVNPRRSDRLKQEIKPDCNKGSLKVLIRMLHNGTYNCLDYVTTKMDMIKHKAHSILRKHKALQSLMYSPIVEKKKVAEKCWLDLQSNLKVNCCLYLDLMTDSRLQLLGVTGQGGTPETNLVGKSLHHRSPQNCGARTSKRRQSMWNSKIS